MKVGSEPDRDVDRVTRAREAIGDDAELFVDANGAYSRKQAIALAADLQEQAGVVWCGAVDLLQADITRCGGVTELLLAVILSTSTVMCALRSCCSTAFLSCETGALWPDLDRPGMGLELRRTDVDA